MTEPTASAGGLSTGKKLLIGCAGVALLLILIAVAGVALGGVALKRQVDSFVGGVESQQEASETLTRLEADHPFEVPEDGVVTSDQLDRFVEATRIAWEEMRPWADDLAELSRRDTAEEAGLMDLARGASAVSGFANARVELAEALDAVEMSAGEYVWTGIRLKQAGAVVEGEASAESAPAENVELVENHPEVLEVLEVGDEEPGPGLVLVVATTWGMSSPDVWRAYGLDTLGAEVR